MERARSLYIHIPFCRAKCHYCDFASFAGIEERMDEYVRALVTEVTHYPPLKLDTLFFGGGTPSLLPADAIASILSAVRERFDVAPDAEVTVEANPATVDGKYFRRLRTAGVNRVSIGVQSFFDDNLRALGRLHTGDGAVATFRQAREAGFENLSIDLIFGLPGQTVETMARDLQTGVGLSPEHISLYQLTVEEGTPLDGMVARGECIVADDAAAVEMYDAANIFLEGEGYRHYEVSNYAKAGRECRHNLAYWMGGEFLGVGSSAHSFVNGTRYVNRRAVEDYLREMAKEEPEREIIYEDSEERLVDYLLMRLRLVDRSLLFADLDNRFGLDFADRYGKILARMRDNGMAKVEQEGFTLTRKGLLFLDNILLDFMSVC